MGKVFCIDDPHIIDLFLHILRLVTKIRGLFVEEIFEHYPAVTLHDDMLEGLVGEGCIGSDGGVGYVLGKLLGQ